MALLALQSLALLALYCWSYSTAELLKSFKEQMGSNISTTNSGAINFHLINIHSDASPFRRFNSTRADRITELLKNDIHPQQALFQRKKNTTQSAAEHDIPLASGAAIYNGNYIIKLGFGTPAQIIYAMVDTGSDVSWIPCNSCQNCTTAQIFHPERSSTFDLMACSSDQCGQVDGICMKNGKCAFSLVYGDNSVVDALLSSDELTAGENGKDSKNVQLSRFIFGCTSSRTGLLKDSPGLIGLGRGNLSFLFQTAGKYGNVFSYCLPSLDSKAFSGTLSLRNESLTSTQGLRFTPLLPNPAEHPVYYYVGLVAISVGNEQFFMPNESYWPSSTGGGTVIDSGSVLTRLIEPLYSEVRDSFRRQMKLKMIAPFTMLDTCYRIPPHGNVVAPQVHLHFEGRLFLALPQESVLISVDDKGSICFAFTSAGGGPDAKSVFGNAQQQNLRIVYDVPGSRLGIAPESCKS